MNLTITESLAEQYFLKRGFLVKRRSCSHSKDILIKGNKGEPDFLLEKDGEQIYLEVKLEGTIFSISQINFIKQKLNEKRKVWVFLSSPLGCFLIFEINNNFKFILINKGFFKLNQKEFEFSIKSNRIQLERINGRTSSLALHLKKLKELKSKRKI